MKTSIFSLLALLSLATSAQASWMGETCSSSDGAIRTSGGHLEMFTEVTVMDYKNGSQTKVRDEEGKWNVEEANEQVIKEERGGDQCNNGMRAPWSRKISVKQVRITKDDGSLFDEYTLGVTSDRKAVEGTLICEWAVSSIVPCK